MEITNQNAGTVLPYVAAQLRECSYFAIDLEFTGIDRDRVSAGAATPAALAELLMRQPSSMYPEKLERIKPYSIVQLGLSIFTRRSESSSTGAMAAGDATVAAAQIIYPTVHDLASELKDLIPDRADEGYYMKFLEFIVQKYRTGGSTNAWETMITLVSKEMAHAGTQACAACSGSGGHAREMAYSSRYATNSVIELLERYYFLEALFRILFRHICEHERMKCSAPTANADARERNDTQQSPSYAPTARSESYQVQTFSAYMFPAALSEAHNVSFNIETIEFLAKNNIDLMRWVRDGLRFKPLKSVVAAVAMDASWRISETEQMFQPHKALPQFTERFNTILDDLLPFSVGELQLIKFVLCLCESWTSKATSRIAKHYIGMTRSLLLFARDKISESSMPKAMFVAEDINSAEVHALAKIGITKVNLRYKRLPSSDAGKDGTSPSIGGSTLTPIATSQGYGAVLLGTILNAAEVLHKPVVVYNGYSDLMFFLLSLYGPQEMPTTLENFKILAHRHFPVLYDTRILACSGPLQELGDFTGRLPSAVEEMSKVSSVAPYVSFHFDSLAIGGKDPSLSFGAHDAGFDAMQAGKLFAYARYAITHANADYKFYLNYLATYNTLLSINLTKREDCVLQEDPAPIFFLVDSFGMRVDSIRKVLLHCGLTALVVFRDGVYTIQPVGKYCRESDYMRLAEAELSRQARSQVTLFRIDI
ncbi:putative Poly(A)-specific ribonuclease PARN [Leptomonas seymouri]|uniref:Putative Poly(A)-specific ribonuclease PARN n=1 Tax=Leptomonas seymouri TaxID=5684 RepID=A0A0N1PGE9_LEPSE|nr:putative Poly(A)-specific ribonuclease PARN [Leptomonas seymouri]|eukprot:KPI90280.1 putative Poly(A)-specific ribonuclease PARN [Leptomonas seymouri]